jgi:hypothetical protein
VSARGVLTVLRDLIPLGIGAWGIVHEEITGHFNPYALVLYGAMIGVPGLIRWAELVKLFNGGQVTITAAPSLEPPVPSSPPSSSSGPSTPGGF